MNNKIVAYVLLLYNIWYFKRLLSKKHVEISLDRNYTMMLHTEQNLEVAPYKTAPVQPLTFHLTSYPSKTNKTGWALLEK